MSSAPLQDFDVVVAEAIRGELPGCGVGPLHPEPERVLLRIRFIPKHSPLDGRIARVQQNRFVASLYGWLSFARRFQDQGFDFKAIRSGLVQCELWRKRAGFGEVNQSEIRCCEP